MTAYADALHPDDRPVVMAALDHSVRTGEDYEAEYRIATTQPPRWVYARASVEKDAQGRPARLAGMVVDVTDRKAAEAEVAFQQHRLELIFRESPAAMALWRGDDLVFEQVNAGYQNLFPGRPLLGKPLLEALPEVAGQGFDDLLRGVLHTGEPVVGRETLARLADAEHVAQESLRQVEPIGALPVGGLEQPAAHAFFDRVVLDAGAVLRAALDRDEGVPHQQLGHGGALGQDLLEGSGVEPEDFALHLHVDPVDSPALC